MIQLRNTVLTLTLTGFLAASMLTNCTSSGNDTDKINENAAVLAREDWIQAQRDSVVEDQNFKTESASRIVKNSQIIADFKIRIMTGEKAMKARYQKRLEALEKKNNGLKNRLEQYSETVTDKREIFKNQWNHEMDDLVKSLNELTKNNKS